MTLEAIKYKNGHLEILDQLLLPHTSQFIRVVNSKDGWEVINKMQVRGAPAVGIVACLSLASELRQTEFSSAKELHQFVKEKMDFLITSRPTAVNILDAARKLTVLSDKLLGKSTSEMKEGILSFLESTQEVDIEMCKTIGRYGANDIKQKLAGQRVTALTHCNTGSLATGGYGTALGVIRSLQEDGVLEHVYCTETRPFNQGARLTAYELVHDKIPSTLICDSAAAFLMRRKNISFVIAGADRIAANGDVANKIGTYQLALAAKHHGILFYIAAPNTSCDLLLESGDMIVIEERSAVEMKSVQGVPVAAEGIGVWNPAFDITPAALITGGIVTEFGVFKPEEFKKKLLSCIADKT